MTSNFIIIYSTTSSREEAERISEILLEKRLAACINMFDKVRSVFYWNGEKAQETEVLMGIKTGSELFEAVKAVIEENHSYEVPEIISVKIENISKKYLDWLETQII